MTFLVDESSLEYVECEAQRAAAGQRGGRFGSVMDRRRVVGVEKSKSELTSSLQWQPIFMYGSTKVVYLPLCPSPQS